MARLEQGDRIGKTAALRLGCAAVIFDETRQKILLTRRSDNGTWCLPGGGMEAGESVAEACIREVWEETGLTIEVTRLIGVYSTPHRIIVYNDGNCVQLVSLTFEARIVAGVAGLSDEVTEVGYFTQAEIATIDLMENHRARIEDAYAGQIIAMIR